MSSTPRSLSPLEAKLILRLEWEKKPVITTEEAIQMLGVSYDHARQILHRLSRDRWLAMIKPGVYELIPAERGELAFADTNPLFIGSALVEPYYFSFATAAFFHGLTTQASLTVYLATNQGKSRLMMIRGKQYRIVIQPTHKFFGFSQVTAYGSPVNMADREKTILDCLDRPSYAGDIPEIAGMLQRGKSSLDWDKLVDYTLCFESTVLIQRLGYLIDRLSLPIKPEYRNMLLDQASGNTKCYLGQPKRWNTGGNYNATWRVVDNIPPQVLSAEIEVR